MYITHSLQVAPTLHLLLICHNSIGGVSNCIGSGEEGGTDCMLNYRTKQQCVQNNNVVFMSVCVCVVCGVFFTYCPLSHRSQAQV